MTYVLWTLAGLSTVAGVFFGWSKHFFGLGIGPEEPLLESWLHPVLDHATINGPERVTRWTEAGNGTEIGLMVLSVGLAILAWFIAKTRYGAAKPADWEAREAKTIGYTLTQNKYYVDEIYQATVIRFFLGLRMLLGAFDKYVVDGFVNFGGVLIRSVAWINGKIDYIFVDGAVRGISEGLLVVGNRVRKVQTGKIQNYVLAALGGVAIFALIAQLLR
jgi:NADH-quinone oxidoreductase subunit L